MFHHHPAIPPFKAKIESDKEKRLKLFPFKSIHDSYTYTSFADVSANFRFFLSLFSFFMCDFLLFFWLSPISAPWWYDFCKVISDFDLCVVFLFDVCVESVLNLCLFTLYGYKLLHTLGQASVGFGLRIT